MNPAMHSALTAAIAGGKDPAAATAALVELMAADVAGTAAAAAAIHPYDVLTPAEVASYLNVSEKAVLTEAAAGRLPGRMIGSEWRFLRTAVTDWLAGVGRPDRPSRTVGDIEWNEETEREAERELARLAILRKSFGTVGDLQRAGR